MNQSANKLKKKSDVAVLDTNIFIADLTTPGLLAAAMEGMDEVVLCTSAVPKVCEAKRRRYSIAVWLGSLSLAYGVLLLL